MTPVSRRWLERAGIVLTILSVGFVAARLRDAWLAVDLAHISFRTWIALCGLACLYALANLLLALAWRHLLALSGSTVPRSIAIRIYGISQIAKYVPGNIFHLAGRQALGIADGIPGYHLAKATLWEIGSLACAAGMFAWLVIPVLLPTVPVAVAALLVAATVAAVAAALRKTLGPHAAATICNQALFHAIAATIFVIVLAMKEAHIPPNAAVTGGAYVLAWLAGLVMPGAPAGLGVREAVLLLLLHDSTAAGDLMGTVLLGRLVTIAGDTLYFLGAARLQRRYRAISLPARSNAASHD